MDDKIVADSELLEFDIPDKFFEYAESYGNAAKALTEKIVSDEDKATWSDSSVILMLSVHSVELFLKGAIYNHNPKADIRSHNIESLYKQYLKIYQKEKYYFNMPFKTEYIGTSKENINDPKENKRPAPSILYRYPTRDGIVEWEGVNIFEAHSFLAVISDLLQNYQRLRKALA